MGSVDDSMGMAWLLCMDLIEETVTRLVELKAGAGFEFHPFKVGWYNSCVQPVFNLPYHDNVLCILVISIPKMFECTLKPFILSHPNKRKGLDYLDQCMQRQFKDMQEILHEHEMDVILDFELDPYRRPRILVQTAGHVSGAAYYYQKNMVTNPPWDSDKKVYGVSMHPVYGGWFAFRGVIILKNLHIDEGFMQKIPFDCVGDESMVAELLKRFNNNWKDWSYRDVTINTVKERYSKDQMEYFITLPNERPKLIEKWIKEINN